VPLRRWVGGAIVLALAGGGFHVALLAPAFLGEHPSGPPDLTVMNLNMRLGNGDAAEAVDLVRETGADVVVLEEVTPALEAALEAVGIGALLPHSSGGAAPGAAGTRVYSAYPLGEDDRLIGVGQGVHRIRVRAPEPFWLMAVHVSQPLSNKGLWRPDWDVLNQVLPALDGPVIAVGDFNTTLEHGPLRDLLAEGFSDAARDANAGFQPTWPSAGLLAIDHVLFTAPYGAVRTRTFEVSGTDHRALVAELAR
jgi:endonuclease/exonuclease/phosphatase (EEP) superfamily protein YafD